MSNGTLGPVSVSDYTTVRGETISANTGAKCWQCGKPMDLFGRGIAPELKCQCPPGRIEPDGTPVLAPPIERQAEATQILAAMSTKIVKLLERLIDSLAPIPEVTAAPAEILPVAVVIPGVTDSPTPVIDPEKLKANEDKKAKLLGEMSKK